MRAQTHTLSDSIWDPLPRAHSAPLGIKCWCGTAFKRNAGLGSQAAFITWGGPRDGRWWGLCNMRLAHSFLEGSYHRWENCMWVFTYRQLKLVMPTTLFTIKNLPRKATSITPTSFSSAGTAELCLGLLPVSPLALTSVFLYPKEILLSTNGSFLKSSDILSCWKYTSEIMQSLIHTFPFSTKPQI